MNPNKEKYRRWCEQTNFVPLFYRYDYYQALFGDNWDVILDCRGENIVGIMPFVLRSKFGFKKINPELLFPYQGIWINYPDNQKNATKISFEKEVITKKEIIEKEIYLQKKEGLIKTKIALEEKKDDFRKGKRNWLEPLKNWILEIKQVQNLVSGGDFLEIAGVSFNVGPFFEFSIQGCLYEHVDIVHQVVHVIDTVVEAFLDFLEITLVFGGDSVGNLPHSNLRDALGGCVEGADNRVEGIVDTGNDGVELSPVLVGVGAAQKSSRHRLIRDHVDVGDKGLHGFGHADERRQELVVFGALARAVVDRFKGFQVAQVPGRDI
ncbi:MAG: hypothetical protein CVT98_03830, partial [Bacteroidetes bacterium HGW-Bacteroidetes-15]